MDDETFKKEVEDLVAMLTNFRLIKDKGRKRWLKVEIRHHLTTLLNDEHD
ncbi:MAG: hypothetical protein K2H47_08665 [Muribaculaceae bacterium]|nr:hypothetical protein [Muribaculaceae bacterium]